MSLCKKTVQRYVSTGSTWDATIWDSTNKKWSRILSTWNKQQWSRSLVIWSNNGAVTTAWNVKRSLKSLLRIQYSYKQQQLNPFLKTLLSIMTIESGIEQSVECTSNNKSYLTLRCFNIHHWTSLKASTIQNCECLLCLLHKDVILSKSCQSGWFRHH